MSGVLKFAGKYRKNIIRALVLISVSVPFGVVPYFIMSGLIGEYLAGTAAVKNGFAVGGGNFRLLYREIRSLRDRA